MRISTWVVLTKDILYFFGLVIEREIQNWSHVKFLNLKFGNAMFGHVTAHFSQPIDVSIDVDRLSLYRNS